MRNVSAERFWLEMESLAAARTRPDALEITDDALREDPARLVMPGTFRLDGAEGHEGLGEESFAGHTPLAIFSLEGDEWHLVSNHLRLHGRQRFDLEDPFAPLRRAGEVLGIAGADPFTGGLVVALSYELGERLLGLDPRPHAGALAIACVHDRLARRRSSGWEVADVGVRRDGDEGRLAWARALPAMAETTDPGDATAGARVVGESLGGDAYRDALARVKAYIAAGDVYQANLTRMLTLELDAEAHAYYRALRARHPGPFSCYLVEPSGATIAGISPELFLRVTGRDVETRPIKGTRPRGATPEQDARLAAELLASEKDAAELLMIVDLMRNDVGREAAFGSVAVPEVRRLDSHPTLHHLSGVVRARLAEGRDVWDLLRSSLPPGSISGAPKRRAVEILKELEPHTRGVYTGVVGVVDFSGNAVLNVAIRTLRIVGRRAMLGVGGGIVADSDAEHELAETNVKARAFLTTGATSDTT